MMRPPLLLSALAVAGFFTAHAVSVPSPASNPASPNPASPIPAPSARLSSPGWIDLGDLASNPQWKGLLPGKTGATLSLPGTASFTAPDGERGSFKHGLRTYNDSTLDWKDYYGMELEFSLPDDHPVELSISLKTGSLKKIDPESAVISKVRLQGKGPHSVTLPWSVFQFPQARTSFLKFIKELSVSARLADSDTPGKLSFKHARVIKAPRVALECAVRGKSAPKDGTAEYQVSVVNCTSTPQAVTLSFLKRGWEEMQSEVTPASLLLAPGESKPCTVTVKVPGKIPPGGHETQLLQVVANGEAAAASQLGFITAAALPHPYLLHTAKGWQEVRDKVKNYPWAQELQEDLLQQALAWQVPEIAMPPHNDPDDTMGPYLFQTVNERGLMSCGEAWQLTGDKAYAEKVALFLRRLSDPAQGYAKTFRACNQSLVQEGHFFQHIAMGYDLILDSGVLSDQDRAQIEACFRLLLETMERTCDGGSINNWNLSEATGAFYCALAMQDLVAAERYFSGPSGICDQLSKGTMDDGWWYECSISYNLWCASEFTQAALAYRPWGVNFLNAWVPANFSPSVMLVSELNGGAPDSSDAEARHKPFGMDPDLYGPIRRPYRTITDLWNSLLPFLDYRCIMFGVNDSTENLVAGNRSEVGGQPFEIAYYAFRDPNYASIIRRGGGKRDLLYGVPDLPEKTPELFRDSAFADNVGLSMLRSQTPDRPIREQIQATLHYGTHGWAHGHFDRTDLLNLMRYGRSFWNPESVFYVYEPFMYKFYTQTSLNHNMVVVDEKMQEATPGSRLLFHTGKLFQATAVETTARWSNPPYGGMVYDYVPVKTFAEKCWREGRSVPIPKDPPKYGSLTGYTEPVLQRRLMVVTDDYLVLADYLKASQPHTFESLLQLKGFQGLDAPEKKFDRHDPQWNPDPIGSAQFVTDCNWYRAQAPSVAHFIERWGPGADEEGSRSIGNEPGELKLDIHTLWPKAQELMVGASPEFFHVEKKVYYSVRGDSKTLAEGKLGAWVLGQEQIEVPIEGLNDLELETKVENSQLPTLFWANARIITKAGKEIPLSDLPVEFSNIELPKQKGSDYRGGPVKIVGTEYQNATPAQPKEVNQPGLARLKLAGLDAVKFQATLGGDYPLGDESQRRKVYAVRSQGTEARFLTVIEPHETKPMVKSAIALDSGKLRVELTDGRVQEIAIKNLEGTGSDIAIAVNETKAGETIRKEETAPGEGNGAR